MQKKSYAGIYCEMASEQKNYFICEIYIFINFITQHSTSQNYVNFNIMMSIFDKCGLYGVIKCYFFKLITVIDFYLNRSEELEKVFL